jgi:6-pyruvoyl-tetrahydropterin synthase
MESKHDDVLFAWLCFFMDFNEIRTTIRQIWSSYDASRISLVNASLLTNAAIEMIRSNCQSQLQAMAGLPFNPKDEDTVCQ